jgi:Protein of unknown function (DUF4232)
MLVARPGTLSSSTVALSHFARSVLRRGFPVAVITAGVVASLAGLDAAASPQNRPVAVTALAGHRLADAAADTPGCSSTQLRAQQVRTEGAAGSVYVTVRFTNVSEQACWLAGYPKVLFFTEDGRPLTTASRRNGGPTPKVVLRPSGTAEFFIRYPNPGVAQCRPHRTHRYLVTPPRASQPLLVESTQKLSLCPGTVSRSPVMKSV